MRWNSLLWIFKEYRDLYFSQQILTEQIVTRDKTIADLEKQLGSPRSEAVDVLMKEYQDAIQDVPFVDGKIPDHFWLTPGENDRDIKAVEAVA